MNLRNANFNLLKLIHPAQLVCYVTSRMATRTVNNVLSFIRSPNLEQNHRVRKVFSLAYAFVNIYGGYYVSSYTWDKNHFG